MSTWRRVGAACAAALAACAPDTSDLATFGIEDSLFAAMEPVVADHLSSAQVAYSDSANGVERMTRLSELCALYHAYHQFEAAGACYERRLELAEDPKTHYLLGNVLLEQGRPARAVEHLRAAYESRPRHWSALLLARALAANDDLVGARSTYEEALQFERTAVALYELSGILRELGEHPAALEALQEAAQKAPEATVIQRSIADVLTSLGRGEEAAEAARSAGDGPVPWEDLHLSTVRALRRGSQAANERGLAAFEEGDYERAAAFFREASEAEVEPTARTIRNLAEALRRLGRTEEGLQYLTEARSRFPGDEDVAWQQGLFLRLLNRPVEARAVWAGFEGSSARMAASLGALELDCGNAEVARHHFERALELQPGLESAKLGRVIALFEQGEERLALQEVRESSGDLGERSFDLEARMVALSASHDVGVSGVLARARGSVAETPTVYGFETLAFLLAESARFEEASAVQQQVIEAVSAAGRSELLPRLRADLARFRQDESTQNPWATFGVKHQSGVCSASGAAAGTP